MMIYARSLSTLDGGSTSKVSMYFHSDLKDVVAKVTLQIPIASIFGLFPAIKTLGSDAMKLLSFVVIVSSVITCGSGPAH